MASWFRLPGFLRLGGGGSRLFSSINQQQQPVQSNAQRFFKFWKTDRGIRTSSVIIVSGSICAGLYQVAPNTLLINFVRDFYQNYSLDRPTKISDDMKRILEAVDNDLRRIQPENRVSAEFFVAACTDVCGWGEPGGSKSIVGFPRNFQFESTGDVPLARMQFGNRGASEVKYLSESELQSDKAKQLVESLIHSDDSKKFAIAREMIKIGLAHHNLQGGIAACFVLLTYLIARINNRKLNLFRKPPILRGLIYLILASGMMLYYLLVTDALHRRMQKMVDEQTANISPDYARGGVEFYTKTLERNIALRDLSVDGTKYWGMTGEDATEWIRTKNLTFAERRTICQDVLNKFAENDALSANSH